ncbi:MAG: hypothetical protein E4H41_04180 [Gemmatimonadales bacterium]|jgi:hypothetical protein|nr:MAG: hypothetical protein E4H41_04180 [Gemmatimonadales bacterium]
MVHRLRRVVTAALLGAAALAACRGEAPGESGDAVGRLVDSLRPAVERTVGLPFKAPPRFAVRSRAQVATYLATKLDEELSPERLAAMHDVYRLLGQVPDSLDIRRLLTALYEEQVAGFFDPDSGMLFVYEGSDVKSAQFKFVLAHELVHALQYDYLALDSIMHQRRDSDRLAAAQAMLEGQATLASMKMMVPGRDLLNDDAIWETFREQLLAARGSMQVFAETPRVLQEGLIFPYLAGAEFVRWYERNRAEAGQPYGAAIPVSTEQVLHPQRYARRDMPVDVPLDTVGAEPGESDVMGEMGLAVLSADMAGNEVVSTTVPIGWAGDRYRLYQSPEGPALVWLIAWDDQRAADRFLVGTGTRLSAGARPGYRTAVEAREVAGHPGTRVVIAPIDWAGWSALP